ncbi:Secondary metabolism regulator LAE1 [Mycena venus]|uniref:Secondary metabolism regulator LAE1 n=1 Tax=Mycena venus TaxID=2733690 RepID=A0A8H7DDJ7_9AGAR|nr:Secondary metabolism regulator LAE1 [Mycena venus]
MSRPDEDVDCYLSVDGIEFFRQRNGCKFNAMNPTYMLPSDDEESKGDWAVELNEEIPWVFVTGVDIVPIQLREVPVRCRFEIWNIAMPDMPYDDAYFDLIHARDVLTGICNYPQFLGQVARILRPGGLVILIKPDLVQYADDKSEDEWMLGSESGPRGWFTLWETYRNCLTLLGVDVTVPQRLRKLLEGTGAFENIEDCRAMIPVGFYPEDKRVLTVGQLQWMAHDLLLPALRSMFLSSGMVESRVDQIIKDAQTDLYCGNTFGLSSHLHIVHATRREE